MKEKAETYKLFYNYILSANSFRTYGMSVYATREQGEENDDVAPSLWCPGKRILHRPEKTISLPL